MTMTMMMKLVQILLLAATTAHAFVPLQASTNNRLAGSSLFAATAEYQTKIDSCNEILKKAALTKDEDPQLVFEALSDLEKLMRVKCKSEPDAAQEVLDNLNGDWRLVFSKYTRTYRSFLFSLFCWKRNLTLTPPLFT
jgi:hypothetical protein